MSAPASPTLVNRKANFADRAITRKSLARASTDPAPAAVPWMAATTGTGDFIYLRESRGGRVWSGAVLPVRREPQSYEGTTFRFCRYERVGGGA